MKIQEHVSLAGYTTFGVGGPARYFAEAEVEADVQEAFHWAAEDVRLPVFVLSGGSNLLIADDGFEGVVLRIAIRGVEQDGCRFDVGAGEPWDPFVDRTLAAGCAGMECLAGIPGSVGATPVQNVGAYGQEVAQTIESVRVFDRTQALFTELTAEQCRFRYRASLFNTEEKGRYVITRVSFALRQGGAPEMRYPDLGRAFAGRAEAPTLIEIAETVRSIRRSKGMVLVPGDADTQSAGSYFKNPIVARGDLEGIARAAAVDPDAVPAYPAGEGEVKLSAAWLVERAGFARGFRLGAAGISTRHTLALTNRGGATCADILRLEATVREGVVARFGVCLEREPMLLGSATEAEVF